MMVKKSTLCYAVIAFSILFFSCSASFSSDDETDSFRDLGNRYSLCVNGDFIEIRGVKGMDVCYVNLNTSSRSALPRESISSMIDIDGVEPNVPKGIVLLDSAQDVRTRNFERKDFAGDFALGSKNASFSRKIPEDVVVGSTRADFYLAKNSRNESDVPDLVNCTLRAEYSSNSMTCLVWVPANAWTAGKSLGTKVNGSVARDIAEKFIRLYDAETSVYGTESDTMYNYVTKAQVEFAGPEKKRINIVVYDIDGDGEIGSSTSSMTGGYFSQRDYFINDGTSVSYSNQAKILYLDSLLCNYRENSDGLNRYGGTEGMSARAYSSLAHELVHLITFAKKYRGNTEASAANKWFNEMLAMMAEDMFSQAIYGSDGTEAARERIGAFNARYYMTGTATFNSTDTANLGYYYSSNFAFGAWLARNYGGVGFVRDLAQSSEYGMGAVLNSVSRISGEKFARDYMLIEQFVQSCVMRNSFAAANGIPGFYKGYQSSGVRKMNPSFVPLDLFSENFSFQLSQQASRISGPLIVSPGTKPSQLGPFGFIISYAGRASEDVVKIKFARRKSSSEEIIVILQNPFSNQVR